MLLSKEDIIYIAGFIDGEAYLGLQKVQQKDRRLYYCLRIGISNTNKDILEWLQKTTETGYIRVNKSNLKLPNRKPCWIWDVATKATIISLLKQVLPYLKVKREIAELLIEFGDVVDQQKKQKLGSPGRGTRRVPEEFEEVREQYYQRVRALNKRGLEL